MKISDIQVTAIHPERWGDDLDVVNAARVSFHKVSEQFEAKDEKLINYLAKHKHFSPFNHSFITMRVKAPIFVARQLVKHKFMPWNEVSRRYVDEPPEFYVPDSWSQRAANVKQGAGEPFYNQLWAQASLEKAVNESVRIYMEMIDSDVAPEQARMVLPQNMMTEWIWSGTLGAWCDMLVLRLDPHTQYESRIVANKAVELIQPYFPVSIKARLDNQ